MSKLETEDREDMIKRINELLSDEEQGVFMVSMKDDGSSGVIVLSNLSDTTLLLPSIFSFMRQSGFSMEELTEIAKQSLIANYKRDLEEELTNLSAEDDSFEPTENDKLLSKFLNKTIKTEA